MKLKIRKKDGKIQIDAHVRVRSKLKLYVIAYNMIGLNALDPGTLVAPYPLQSYKETTHMSAERIAHVRRTIVLITAFFLIGAMVYLVFDGREGLENVFFLLGSALLVPTALGVADRYSDSVALRLRRRRDLKAGIDPDTKPEDGDE